MPPAIVTGAAIRIGKAIALHLAAKGIIIAKMNKAKSIGTFKTTPKGMVATNPEGYVAVDRIKGNAVKLVDRMEFSFNTFTARKAWDK